MMIPRQNWEREHRRAMGVRPSPYSRAIEGQSIISQHRDLSSAQAEEGRVFMTISVAPAEPEVLAEPEPPTPSWLAGLPYAAEVALLLFGMAGAACLVIVAALCAERIW
jgi:hypothetical protein